jgi:excisionase family DNA binding protein
MYLSTQQVEERFSVTRQTLIRWVKNGKLSDFRTAGGHRRYSVNELEGIFGVSK